MSAFLAVFEFVEATIRRAAPARYRNPPRSAVGTFRDGAAI